MTFEDLVYILLKFPFKMETRAGKAKREKEEEDLGRAEEEATGARKRVCRARGLSQGGTLKVDKNTGQDNGKAKIEDILPSSSAAGVVEENAMEVVDLVSVEDLLMSDEDEGFALAGVEEVDEISGKEDGDALSEVFVGLSVDHT